MDPIIFGIGAIILGLFLIPFGYYEFKSELQIVKAQSKYKKIFIYLITFISLFNLDTVIGWVLSLGILLILIGSVFIFLSVV